MFGSIVEAQNATLNFNRQQEFSGILSASAPEFVPKTIHPHEWHPPQPGIEHQQPPHQVYPYSAGPRYVNHQQPQHIQQIPPQHPRQHPMHQGHHPNHRIQHHQHQAPHHHFQQSNQQHMQQFMMMNNGNQHHGDFHGPRGGGSIQNRLHAHQGPAAPQQQVQEEEVPHAQVSSFFSFAYFQKSNLSLQLPDGNGASGVGLSY